MCLSLSQDPINTQTPGITPLEEGRPHNLAKPHGDLFRADRRLDITHTAHGPRSHPVLALKSQALIGGVQVLLSSHFAEEEKTRPRDMPCRSRNYITLQTCILFSFKTSEGVGYLKTSKLKGFFSLKMTRFLDID